MVTSMLCLARANRAYTAENPAAGSVSSEIAWAGAGRLAAGCRARLASACLAERRAVSWRAVSRGLAEGAGEALTLTWQPVTASVPVARRAMEASAPRRIMGPSFVGGSATCRLFLPRQRRLIVRLFRFWFAGVQDAQHAGAHRAAEHLADQRAVGGVQGPDRGAGESWLHGGLAASGASWLGRDPQVAGVAAFEVGDDDRARVQPPVDDLGGLRAQRVGVGAEVGPRFGFEADVADVEAGEFGDGAAGGGDQGCYGRCAQRRGGVGV